MKKNTGQDALDIFKAAVATVSPANLMQHPPRIDETCLYSSCSLRHPLQGQTSRMFLMGGETTLKVKGVGKKDRNQHFVLFVLDEVLRSSRIKK